MLQTADLVTLGPGLNVSWNSQENYINQNNKNAVFYSDFVSDSAQFVLFYRLPVFKRPFNP